MNRKQRTKQKQAKGHRRQVYRQGDVLIVRSRKRLDQVDPIARDDQGRIVLAHGEVTGHAHAIADVDAVLVARGSERFLRIAKPVELRHEEHSTITIPPGDFEIIRQREYSPEEIKYVQD